MKKSVLLLYALLVCSATFAQQNTTESVVLKDHKAQRMVPRFEGPMPASSLLSQGAAKTTAGGSRWYWPYELTGLYLGATPGDISSSILLQNGNRYLFYIDWDSTIYQRFSNGSGGFYYGPVNWLAVGQYIDPVYSQGFNATTYYDGSEIKVIGGVGYKVDSIRFPGAYMQGISGGLPGTIDNLFLSVAAVPFANERIFSDTSVPTSTYAKVNDYEGVADHNHELRVADLGPALYDSNQLTGTNVIRWRYPLPDTLRKVINTDGSYPTRYYTLPVPNGGLNVPPGNNFAVTVSFKPGENWNYKDSVTQYHYFMAIASQVQNAQRMPYFYYDYNDRSMSYLFHYTKYFNFAAVIGTEIRNDYEFDKEFMDIAGHVVCDNCWTLDAGNLKQRVISMIAYPNPAGNEVGISFALKKATDVTISLANLHGQTIRMKKVADAATGKVIFEVADLPGGVYLYSVEADGESIVRRVTIAH
jgi:hypothetical protein